MALVDPISFFSRSTAYFAVPLICVSLKGLSRRKYEEWTDHED